MRVAAHARLEFAIYENSRPAGGGGWDNSTYTSCQRSNQRFLLLFCTAYQRTKIYWIILSAPSRNCRQKSIESRAADGVAGEDEQEAIEQKKRREKKNWRQFVIWLLRATRRRRRLLHKNFVLWSSTEFSPKTSVCVCVELPSHTHTHVLYL